METLVGILLWIIACAIFCGIWMAIVYPICKRKVKEDGFNSFDEMLIYLANEP